MKFGSFGTLSLFTVKSCFIVITLVKINALISRANISRVVLSLFFFSPSPRKRNLTRHSASPYCRCKILFPRFIARGCIVAMERKRKEKKKKKIYRLFFISLKVSVPCMSVQLCDYPVKQLRRCVN